MQPNVVELTRISKRFRRRRERGDGVAARIAALVSPRFEEVSAVEDLSFEIRRGERVAFIGPNGAGKSTTLKILAGIVAPDSGSARVLGLSPFDDRRTLGFRVGTVFGQRSQLWYELPARDSFELFAGVYELPRAGFAERLSALADAFEIANLLDQPVRQLSLGERMRCEIAASLLHAPELLFLDEPTIGLDVSGKAAIRAHLRRQSEEDGATLILTSHDTGDIERVCERMIVMHRGRLLIDGPIAELRQRYLGRRRLTVLTEAESVTLDLPGVHVIRREPYRTLLEIESDKVQLGRVVDAVSRSTALLDLEIEDPPLDEIIRALYASAERTEVA